jgi:nucleoside-diphosphate-sugar epimerase
MPTPRVVAVTGGGGFIGRRLVALHLGLGDHVRLLSRTGRTVPGAKTQVTIVPGDLTAESVRLDVLVRNADVLYHCAGETRDKSKMQAVHLTATERLLAAAAGHIKHWVQLSSVGVYGPVRSGVITESSPFAPLGEYETSKAASERLIAERAPTYGYSYSILRPSIVFGPEMPGASLRQIVRMIERGLFFYIGQPGANVPCVAVEDVVEALYRCATRPVARNQAYNLSANLSIESLASMIAEVLGRRPPRLRVPEWVMRATVTIGTFVPGFPLTRRGVDALTSRAVYDSSKIKRELDIDPDSTTRARIEAFVKQLYALGR